MLNKPRPPRHFHTFIISSRASSRPLRISFPNTALLAAVVLSFVGAGTVGAAAFHYGRMLLKVQDYNRLLTENNTYRTENQNYRIQTAQLGEKIDFLETLSRRLMLLAGNGPNGIGGVGGISQENLRKPLKPAAGTLQAIDGYNRAVGQLEDRYRNLRNTLAEKALIASATPAFLPVRGYVTGGMGRREDPITGNGTDYHYGLDISAPYGRSVIAPADGIVLFSGQRAGYGNIVVVDHKFGVTTRYGHLWKSNVMAGQHVSRNDVIGYVGTTGRTTGPHLHFELLVHNRAVNPLKFIGSVGTIQP